MLGDSNIVQFKKDYHGINFEVWGNLVPGRRKVEKVSEVNKSRHNVLKLFLTSHSIDVTKICKDEVQVTALFTDSKRDQSKTRSSCCLPVADWQSTYGFGMDCPFTS